MILKIGTGEGWRFIDKVDDIEVNKMRKEDKEQISFPCQHYYCNDNNEWMNKIRVMRQETQGYCMGSNLLFIKTDQVVYILDDTGKTIERIN